MFDNRVVQTKLNIIAHVEAMFDKYKPEEGEGMEKSIDEPDLQVYFNRKGSSESQDHFLYRTTSTFNSGFKIGRVIKSVRNFYRK